MSDLEGAIDAAWNQSKWQRVKETGKCVIHHKWAVCKRKMTNGEIFGPARTEVWYKHVFATCSASFKDGVALTVAKWRKQKDHVGAQFLLDLATNSKAPLHKWPPITCPHISGGSGESVNQMYKGVLPGEKRVKMTQVQLVRKIIKLGYRSFEVLRDGPVQCKKTGSNTNANY